MGHYQELQQKLSDKITDQNQTLAELQSQAQVVYAAVTNKLGVAGHVTTADGTTHLLTWFFNSSDGKNSPAKRRTDLTEFHSGVLDFGIGIKVLPIGFEGMNAVLDIECSLRKHEDHFHVKLKSIGTEYKFLGGDHKDPSLQDFADAAFALFKMQIRDLF